MLHNTGGSSYEENQDLTFIWKMQPEYLTTGNKKLGRYDCCGFIRNRKYHRDGGRCQKASAAEQRCLFIDVDTTELAQIIDYEIISGNERLKFLWLQTVLCTMQ